MHIEVILCLVSLFFLLIGETTNKLWMRIVFKACASTLFLVTAYSFGALDDFISSDYSIGVLFNTYGGVVFISLVLGWIGDMALIPEHNNIAFKLGLVSFLLGHVGYVYAFYMVVPADITFISAGAAIVVVQGILIWRWLGSYLPGDMMVPVVAYVLVISVMVVTAMGMLGAILKQTSNGTGLITNEEGDYIGIEEKAEKAFIRFLGAYLFYLSDICVARNKFVKKSVRNRIIGLPLYYCAQLLIALSV